MSEKWKRACDALKKILPGFFKNPNWDLIKDETVKSWHVDLLNNLGFVHGEEQSDF